MFFFPEHATDRFVSFARALCYLVRRRAAAAVWVCVAGSPRLCTPARQSLATHAEDHWCCYKPAKVNFFCLALTSSGVCQILPFRLLLKIKDGEMVFCFFLASFRTFDGSLTLVPLTSKFHVVFTLLWITAYVVPCWWCTLFLSRLFYGCNRLLYLLFPLRCALVDFYQVFTCLAMLLQCCTLNLVYCSFSFCRLCIGAWG